MLDHLEVPQTLPGASHLPRLLSCKHQPFLLALCFHKLTKPYLRNFFVLIFIQNARGWGIQTRLALWPLFPSLSKEQKSTRLFSTVYALFAQKSGGVRRRLLECGGLTPLFDVRTKTAAKTGVLLAENG